MDTAPDHIQNHAQNHVDIHEIVEINASAETVFNALVHRFADGNTGAENAPMPMKLELWPGGRWFRDLGDINGHLWGHVQSIKKPHLLELYGQLFMSMAVSNHIIIRISEENGKSTLDFRHQAFGALDMDYIEGMKEGWAEYLGWIKADCE